MNDRPTRPANDPEGQPAAALLDRLAGSFADRPAPLPGIVAAAHRARARRRRRDAVLVAAALVVVVGTGAAVVRLAPDGPRSLGDVAGTPTAPTAPAVDHLVDACAGVEEAGPGSEPVPRGPDYPTNARGQTYGAAGDGAAQPDLVAATGTCGRVGYVVGADLAHLGSEAPWEPGAGGAVIRSIPVYLSDGRTQVDSFQQEPGVALGQSSGPAPPGPGPDQVQGTWTAVVAGLTSPAGQQAYDTFRDLDLRLTFHGDEVTAYDGCRPWTAGYELDEGAFALTRRFVPAVGSDACERQAPLTAVLANVRLVTQSGGRVLLHLTDGRIALSLTPAG